MLPIEKCRFYKKMKENSLKVIGVAGSWTIISSFVRIFQKKDGIIAQIRKHTNFLDWPYDIQISIIAFILLIVGALLYMIGYFLFDKKRCKDYF